MRRNLVLCLFCGLFRSGAAAAVPPKIDFPKDAPVSLISSDYTGTTESARGGAMVLDLRAVLTLRNDSGRRIRGITLLVLAQEVTPGGKASVTAPSLSVAPGEAFPVRLDLRVLRPLQSAMSAAVEVRLDGVLFDDLGFYGPNRLNSRRALTVYEVEARRDRRYYQALLEEAGPRGLQREMLAALALEAERPGMDVQLARAGRATNQEAERSVQLAFLEMPDSPVAAKPGTAMVAGSIARAPRFELLNRSRRAVRSVEIGWIVRDGEGRESLGGSVPVDVSLRPGERGQILKDARLSFPQGTGSGQAIAGLTAFVSNVEFSSGRMWVPGRRALANPLLERVLAPSAEQERLMQLYRRKGLKALVAELRKF